MEKGSMLGAQNYACRFAHCRRWANHMLLLLRPGNLGKFPGVPPDTDIDANDFVS